MAEYTSEIKTIPHADTDIYPVLSDLRNLEKIKDRIPEDKVQEFSYDQDSCTVSVNPIGKIKFNIVDRQPNSTIKFEAEQVPFPLNLWIQLKPTGETETKLKLTVKADISPFLKPMVSKPLQQAIDKIAELMVNIPYDKANTPQ